ETHGILDQVAKFLLENEHVELVDVVGHTHPEGDAEANERLSKHRAESVVKYLVAHKISSKRLVAKGAGGEQPIVGADAKVNNRVEFEVTRERERPPLLDRFLAQHYIRLHTVPLGQWMSMEFARLAKLWNDEPVGKLIDAIKESGPRLGAGNAQIVDQVV